MSLCEIAGPQDRYEGCDGLVCDKKILYHLNGKNERKDRIHCEKCINNCLHFLHIQFDVSILVCRV